MTSADARARADRLVEVVSLRIRPVPVDLRRAIRRLLDASPHLLEPQNADLLGPALCSLLARDADEADRIAEVYEALRRPAPPAASAGGETEPPPRTARAPWVLGLIVLATALLLWGIEQEPSVPSEAPGLTAPADAGPSGAPRGDPDAGAVLRPAPSEAGPHRVPFEPARGGPATLDIAPLGLSLFLLLVAVRLWLVFLSRRRLAERAAEQLRDRADAAMARVAAGELAVRLPTRSPCIWSPAPPGAVAAGHRLSRAYVAEPGTDLDAQRTARRTADAAGRFEPVFRTRRRWRRLTILLDDEGGEHVWAGAFRAIVAQWRSAGVELQAWRFDRDPLYLSALHDNRVITLDRLARGAVDEPLLILSRGLDPRTGRGRWLRTLKGWSIAVWIDPDPRRMHSRRFAEREVIRRLTSRHLLRLPMTTPGLLAAAEALQTRQAHLRTSVPWPGLPDRATPRVREALDRWRLAVSQKPDATWALVEHLRCTVPGVAAVFRHRHDVQLLIDDIHSEGASRRDRPGDRPGTGHMVFVEQKAAVDWLYGMLRSGRRGRAVNHRVSDLLIDWERAHPLASPHDRAVSAVKVLWHRTKQRPTRARIERLANLAGTALHDYVEDYLGALAGAADRGLLLLDSSARRALAIGRSEVLGQPDRVPTEAIWRARWPRTIAVVAALAIAWGAVGWWLWQALSSTGRRPVAADWQGEAPLAGTSTPVSGYLEYVDAGAPALHGPGDAGRRQIRADGNVLMDLDATVGGDGGAAAGDDDEATDGGATAGDSGEATDSGATAGDSGEATDSGDNDWDVIDAGPAGLGADVGTPPSTAGSAGRGPTVPRRTSTRPPRRSQRDLRCGERPACALSGRCVQRGRVCVAAKRADCEASEGCTYNGRCTPRGGFCTVGGDADCERARACSHSGHCAARGGRCIATSTADCEASSQCTLAGHCALIGRICRPGTVEDCTRSVGCARDGDCGLDPRRAAGNRLCTPFERRHCTASDGCQSAAACTLRDGRCQLTSAADCRASRLCTVDGQCTLAGAKCVAFDDETCAASRGCKVSGHCAKVGDVCLATLPEHCRKLCVTEARCTISGGECTVGPHDCAKSELCGVEGRCATEGGRCFATTRQDCAESVWGRKYGLRTPVDGKCIAATSDDCKASDVCRFQGLCTARWGTCRAVTLGDCRKLCRERGACRPHGDRCAPLTPEDCQTSQACSKRGACDLVGTGKGSTCEPTDPEHCVRSTICTTNDQCRLEGSQCVKGEPL